MDRCLRPFPLCPPPSPIAYVQHSRFAICQHHTRRHETHTIYAFILIRAISSQAVCLHVRSRTWSSPLSQHGASPDYVYDTMYLVAFRSQNKQTNSGVDGWQRRQFPNGFHSYHTFCSILLGQENGVGGWQMPSTGVEYYRTYENCENR